MSKVIRSSSRMPGTEFLSDDLWARISMDAQASVNRMAAVGYVTDASQVPFRDGDTLVVDASDRAVTTGLTNAELLQELLSSGVHLYSLPSLHAKVYVFDDIIFVGSCNLSHSSRTALHEAAIRTVDSNSALGVRQFFQALLRSAEPIDQPFVTRIRQLLVEPRQPSDEETGPRQASSLWRLETPPPSRDPNMRPYFVALMKAQLGELREGQPFHLWKGHFGHKDRMEKSGEQFVLTKSGVTYFSPGGKGAPGPDLLEAFLAAVTTGSSDRLPQKLINRVLVPLLEAASQ
ncbi:phospholipase D-like domain-containing protein [Polaromonas sp. P1(28)-8]|nr:phospholipase D-like domain-containing protein [Polaromonas sp. P1(28)-8]